MKTSMKFFLLFGGCILLFSCSTTNYEDNLPGLWEMRQSSNYHGDSLISYYDLVTLQQMWYMNFQLNDSVIVYQQVNPSLTKTAHWEIIYQPTDTLLSIDFALSTEADLMYELKYVDPHHMQLSLENNSNIYRSEFKLYK